MRARFPYLKSSTCMKIPKYSSLKIWPKSGISIPYIYVLYIWICGYIYFLLVLSARRMYFLKSTVTIILGNMYVLNWVYSFKSEMLCSSLWISCDYLGFENKLGWDTSGLMTLHLWAESWVRKHKIKFCLSIIRKSLLPWD